MNWALNQIEPHPHDVDVEAIVGRAGAHDPFARVCSTNRRTVPLQQLEREWHISPGIDILIVETERYPIRWARENRRLSIRRPLDLPDPSAMLRMGGRDRFLEIGAGGVGGLAMLDSHVQLGHHSHLGPIWYLTDVQKQGRFFSAFMLAVTGRKRHDPTPSLESHQKDLKESTMLHQFGFKTLAALSVLALGTVMIAPATARSDENDKDKTPITAKSAFTQLKTLAGTWNNKVSGHHEHEHANDTKVIYRLTGAGSALVETDFPESDHEMVSVYHLDGDDLRLTHYCADGQPAPPQARPGQFQPHAARLRLRWGNQPRPRQGHAHPRDDHNVREGRRG